MDIATVGGIGIGFLLMLAAIIIAGNPLGLFVDPVSIIIVLFGSFAGMVVASPLKRALGISKVAKIAFNLQEYNKEALITQLVAFADSARKEGLLSLDDALNDVEDDFLRGGLRLVVDGTDPDVIKKALYGNVSMIDNRHQDGISFFGTWGSLAPAFGMIGTLLGLVGMMNNLEDTASVGPNLAVALLTTLYGSVVANLFLIPIQAKLEDRNKEELEVKEIMIQGILSIQAGDNPRLLEDRLYTYLAPQDRPQRSANAEE